MKVRTVNLSKNAEDFTLIPLQTSAAHYRLSNSVVVKLKR